MPFSSSLRASCSPVIGTPTYAREASRRLGARPPSEAPALPDNREVGCGLLIVGTFDVPHSLKELYDLSDVVVEGVVATTFPSRGVEGWRRTR
jgi:hypothetical protein